MEKQLYELVQRSGKEIFKALVIEPKVKNGGLYAIQVYELNCINQDGTYNYKRCQDKEIIVIGSAICTAVPNQFL